MPPIEPDRTAWQLPNPAAGDPNEDLLAVGADLAAGTLLGAYRSGLFPMGIGPGGGTPVGWWSPNPRGVLPLAQLKVSRSLGKSAKLFDIRVNSAFDQVVLACANPQRSGCWITPEVLAAYSELHRLGWAHSVECWSAGELVGGLYGVAIGGLFAGESMFHQARDASKVALVALVQLLSAGGAADQRLLDVQWSTPHLVSLGVQEISRTEYLDRLRTALPLELPPGLR